MLHRDATDLYDLPEAGRLLFTDPARLEREARRGRIPYAVVGAEVGLPAPWVEAAAGIAPIDEASSRDYWLARLAPPSPDARRPLRARDRLPATDLLEPGEAARRVFADRPALVRLDAEGVLPALRVDGETRYDATLVDLVAAEEVDPAAAAAAAERRALVREWRRYEYATEMPGTPVLPVPPAPLSSETPKPTATDAAAAASPLESAPAPKAYEVPTDLLEEAPPTPRPPSRLIRTEGHETVDEP